MIRLTGILKAFGMIVFVLMLFFLMMEIFTYPSLFYWWRGDYLVGGFVAILVIAIIFAMRSRESLSERAEYQERTTAKGGAAKSILRATLVAFGAFLLFGLIGLTVGRWL